MNRFAECMERGRSAERRFAEQYLTDVVWASKDQDIYEHWDMEGNLNGKRYKFDIKTSKRIDPNFEHHNNHSFWVEGTNVNGDKGWVKGNADYIVFERAYDWCIADRKRLFDWVVKKLEENGFKKGKGHYEVYQRQNRKDKVTYVKYSDLPSDVAFFLEK